MKMKNKLIQSLFAIFAVVVIVSTGFANIVDAASANSGDDVTNVTTLRGLNYKTENNTFPSIAAKNIGNYTLTEFKEGVGGNIEAKDDNIILQSPLGNDWYDNASVNTSTNGNLYLLVSYWGESSIRYKIERVTPSGERSVFYSFPESVCPYDALAFDSVGNLYLLVSYWGESSIRYKIERVTPSGERSVFYSFPESVCPYDALTFAAKPPVANFTYSPENPVVGGRITFNASSSYDPDGNITNYKWNFGDGNITPTENATITHIYKHPDIYNVTLTIMDNDGLKNTTSKDIDLSLKPGDLLLCRSPGSVVPGFWTHVGMYIGDDKIVEALPKPGVTNTSLTDWSYPNKTCVEALRVKTTDETRNKAVSFALSQVGKSYDFFWLRKELEGERWYCSELVWAAYLNASNGTINIEYGHDMTGITPTEIDLDGDTEMIGEHKERVPKRGFWIVTKSPVDLSVTDPDDFSINKESTGISGAIYGEDDLDGDGDPDDWIGIPERKVGNYSISVIPEPDAAPTDTYTLEVLLPDTTIVLAEKIQISDIPSKSYVFKSSQKGDLNSDGILTPADAAIVLQMSVRGEYSGNADVSGDDRVTSLDALMILQAAAGGVSL